jgi:hypothetical protein
VRFSRTGLLSIARFVQEQLLIPITDNSGARDFEILQHLPETLPFAAFALTATVQPLEDNQACLVIKGTQHVAISTDTIIVIVPLKFGAQLFHDHGSSKLAPLFPDPGQGTGTLLKTITYFSWTPDFV